MIFGIIFFSLVGLSLIGSIIWANIDWYCCRKRSQKRKRITIKEIDPLYLEALRELNKEFPGAED